MSRKKILLIVITVVLAVGAPLTALGLKKFRSTSPKASAEEEPQLVRVSQLTAETATITWLTSSPLYGFVSYGDTVNLGKTSQESTKTETHRVVLADLKPKTTYYFEIGSGSNVFDDRGAPYSFTTPAKEEAVTTPKETPAPPTTGGGTTTEVSLAGFKAAIEGGNLLYDLNGDGVVNAADISLFISRGQPSN